MQIISNIALITINETLIIQVVSFLVFLFLINRIMFRPLKQTMDERDQYIDQLKTDVVDSEGKLDKLTERIREEERIVRSEAIDLSRELEASGTSQATEIFAAAADEINSQIEKARVDIDAQIAQARITLQKESESLATLMMEKLLDRELSQ